MHDIFIKDGITYLTEETDLIKLLAGKNLRDKGQLKIVYHSQFDAKNIHPGIVHISTVNFVKDKNYSYEIIEIDKSDLSPLYLKN